MYWIHLAYDTDQWWAVVINIMVLRIAQWAGNVLSS
jgi:hypothetical protein